MTPHLIVPPTNQFPRKLEFLFEDWRYKVLYGGRGGAKSWGIAGYLVACALIKKELILCAREFQNSITESVHRLICNRIEDLGLGYQFIITDTSIIAKATGSEFIFAGLRTNTRKVKSTEGITKCWVEEAEKVSKQSWKILIPTIRTEGSEIIVSFNPDEETDPTYQMFVVHPPPNAKVVEINWRDNPWFPEVLRKEKDHLFSVDAEAAEHIWEGKCNTKSQAQVFYGKYVVRDFVPHETWDGPYYGMDFGFSTDPAAVIKMWIWDDELLIEKEAFGYGVMNDDLPTLVRTVVEDDRYVIRADSSRPETIAHLNQHGLNVIAAKKWSGSVEDGIAFMRTFKRIVIHSRCRHMQDEARLYRYKVDRLTGDILPVIVDKHNHGWDAGRYGIDPLINSTAEDVVVIGEDVLISPEIDEGELRPDW